ncbi:MAG: excinuclease ABC subunit UvrC [Geobacter sp.]|nr:excinuclease ABC subunit UvrC [Geobacter sp.]
MISADRIKAISTAPGVYLMKGAQGTILYVGKARNLRQRVRSYFGPSRDSRYQIRFLLEQVTDLETIVTDTEKEALILENTLIKQHRPKYNINLRDDKTYFSLRLNSAEEFPRLTVVRKVAKDGADYFGPYASASAARAVVKQLYRLFPLRHYPLETCRRRRRPCLFYQIRQCSAPCHGLISRDEYQRLVDGVALFLSGRSRDLVKSFQQSMAEAAAGQRYEEAARYRDLLRDIQITLERQKMVTRGGDLDAVGLHSEQSLLVVVLLFIRGGTVTGSRSYHFSWELDLAEAVASFLAEYYSQEVTIPDEVLLPLALPEGGGLAELLSERRGRKVLLTTPRRGIKSELVELAAKNASTAAQEYLRGSEDAHAILEELASRLHLSRLPHRIECYDISNFQGGHAVGSRVTFVGGKPDTSLYRRYRIRTVAQSDDFAMLDEVLSRRIRGSDEDPLPDLIIVDGGLGQLNILIHLLESLGISGIEAAGLAKSRVRPAPGQTDVVRSAERVFRPGRKNPIVLRQNSPPLLLLARIRDEAHRFAVSYHKKLRERENSRSLLQEVPGVGPKLSRVLLRHFGSLAEVRSATIEQISAVSGITRTVAEAVSDALDRQQPTEETPETE